MNKIKRPFEIRITNAEEIRMGSPYNHCEIELVGFDKLKLPRVGWQDKYTWTDDSKNLVLIMWDLENNDPGFHLFLIDTETGNTKTSPKLRGLPINITITANKVKLKKFLHDKEKSTMGKLCCEVDEDFEFT